MAIYFTEKAGNGVMATADIKAGTVLSCYPGELTIRKEMLTKDCDYTMQLYESAACLFYVCGKEYRGIGGFMQHLPLDFETTKTYLTNTYQDPVEKLFLLQTHPKLKEVEDFINELIEINFPNDITELATFKFKETEKHNVATANVTQKIILYNGFSIPVLIASCNIKKGEPVGFSYGYNYWVSKGKYPLLFRRDGTPLSEASYKRITVNIPFENEKGEVLPLQLSAETFNKISAFQTKLNKFPPAVSTKVGVLSTYFMREMFAAANAAGAENCDHLPLSSFALGLLTVLTKISKQITVSTYWQNPLLTYDNDNYGTIDVVCRAKSVPIFNLMFVFFRKHDKPIEIEPIPETKEIIIRGTNEPERLQELNEFIRDAQHQVLTNK